MSKEIREQINKVKNFGQSLNENVNLSEKDFYKKFIAIHNDKRTKGGSKDLILKNGFYKGRNVNALPFYKSFDAINKLYPDNYNPKNGDFIWLLTKDGVFNGPNGYMTVKGYIPETCDGFFIVDDEKTIYYNYLNGCNTYT